MSQMFHLINLFTNLLRIERKKKVIFVYLCQASRSELAKHPTAKASLISTLDDDRTTSRDVRPTNENSV